MATLRRRQYAGPSIRFSTVSEVSRVSILLVPICVATVVFPSCVSPSRERLPPGSPFTAQVEVEKPSLPDGTAVGDITSHSAELWLKTAGSKRIQVEWASVEAWRKISAMASVQSPAARTPPLLTGPETDFTVTVSFEKLSPNTRYRYYVLVSDPDAGKRDFRPHVAAQGEFTTLPEASASVPLTFAWSGDLGGQDRCRQGEGGYPIFDTIREQKPDFFVFLGDTIYGDNVCLAPPNEPGTNFIATTLGEYRAKHHYQRGAAALRRFLETVPVYVVWDDHEVKNNFAGPFEAQMPAGRQALREYWPIHTDLSDPHRLYRQVRYGSDLELFLLDTRQYRSRNADPDGPAKTMLGAAQLRWLLDGMEASTATWKVIVTSVPLSVPKGGGLAVPGYDGWAGGTDGTGFERERQVIVDAIVEKQIANVVFLGGDIHWVQANIYDPNQDGVVDFHEFVSGPLSARPGHLTAPSPVLHPNTLINEEGYDNFGLVRVSKEVFDVSIIDATGKTRFSYRVQARKG
jgi:alkaline phosphatase D